MTVASSLWCMNSGLIVEKIDTRAVQLLMRSHGVSQRDLAKTFGVDETLVSRYIHNTRTIPFERLCILAEKIGAQVGDIATLKVAVACPECAHCKQVAA